MGISLHGGSDGQTGVSSSTGDFEIRLKGALEVECLSLFGSPVKGTWREGFLAGDPEEYIKKTLETGISFQRSPFGEPGGGLVYRGL